jgi:hypothetical protein
MNLYYVDHSVVVTQRYVLVATDEDDLKRLLAERAEAVKAVQFVSKIERDKKGNVVAHELSADWPYAPHGPKWDGTSKKE